jgi:hypothetical protein
MYKYEGIGSIYWHQNAKFLLSFQELFTHAAQNGHEPLKPLKEAYYRLRAGFGFDKEPSLWGAFPLEPYSHTPYGMPAQQPGMTGQVKEEVLTRYSELGLNAQDGVLRFNPALLRQSEFLTQPSMFRHILMNGETWGFLLEEGELAFTVCQTPVVYRLASENKIVVYSPSDETMFEVGDLSLNAPISRSLFMRDETIGRIVVNFPASLM